MGAAIGEELATQAGSEARFEEVFERYFGQLYDFSIRLARDRELAALVVQESFLAAWAALQDSGAPAPFQQVLFADAHNALARHLRERPVRVQDAPAAEPFAALNQNERPDLALTPELAEVAWLSAAELRLDDYELLDLSIRRSWETAGIAAMLRSRPTVIEQRLAHAHADFERQFSTLFLFSRRRSCLELDFLVSDEAPSRTLRRRISRHVAVCQTCQETLLQQPAGSDFLRAIALVPAPPGWQDAMLSRLQEALGSGITAAVGSAAPPDLAAEPVPDNGASVTKTSPRRAGRANGRPPRAAILGGGGLLLLVLFLGGVCATGAFQSGSSAPAQHSVAATTAIATPTAPATATATVAPPTPTPTLKPPAAPHPTVPPKKKKP